MKRYCVPCEDVTGNLLVWSEYDLDMSDRGIMEHRMSSDLGLSVSWIGAMSSSGGSWGVLVDWRFLFFGPDGLWLRLHYVVGV